MPTVRNVTLEEEVDYGDAAELSKDIRRMIRRAREAKRANMFIDRAAKNLSELVNQFFEDNKQPNFDDYRQVAARHRDEALQAIRPFVGFFRSNGLLPDEVNDDAHLLFILVQAEQLGYVSYR